MNIILQFKLNYFNSINFFFFFPLVQSNTMEKKEIFVVRARAKTW